MSKQPFWEEKHLFDFTDQEWEAVCDGCAKCCLTQLQDEDTEQRVFTNVACDLLDGESCRCTKYDDRSKLVPTCITMNADNVEQWATFAPSSCAYRLLLLGEPLPDWHHLVCGDRDEIHRQGKSVKSKFVFANTVEESELENFVIDWAK